MDTDSRIITIYITFVSLILVLLIIRYIYQQLRRLAYWIVANGHWFPKEMTRQHLEEVESLEKTNSQLDLYNSEMKKQTYGIFRHRPSS
jgi:hypothetical protein